MTTSTVTTAPALTDAQKKPLFDWWRNKQPSKSLSTAQVVAVNKMLDRFTIEEAKSILISLDDGKVVNSETDAAESAFFDWLRNNQDNKRLSQNMVDGAKMLIGHVPINEIKQSLSLLNEWQDDPTTSLVMKMSKSGIETLDGHEGFVPHPYLDVAKVWTIGFGNTYYENGTPVTKNDPHISKARGIELKMNIINQIFAPAVNLIFAKEIAAGKVNQNMFDALVSFSYNVGTEGLKTSQVAKKLKAGDKAGAANAMLAWNKITVNGVKKISDGLVNRRNKEKALFLA